MKHSALVFYDYYHLRGDSVHIEGSRSLKVPIGTTLQRPETTAGMIRHNTDNDSFEFGISDKWISLSSNEGQGTFVNRLGDSMEGDLKFWADAKVLATTGTVLKPSYSFVDDTDTGIFQTDPNTLAIVVGGDLNQTPVISFSLTGTNNCSHDKLTTIAGVVEIDELKFKRQDGLRLDGDYAFFTGTHGLRLPAGTTAQREHTINFDPAGIIRYNTETTNFEFGIDNAWIEFGNNTVNSTVMITGSTMTGDLSFNNDARIIATMGTALLPSITFKDNLDTGWFATTDTVGLVVNADINDTPVMLVKRTGTTFDGNEVTINGNLIVTGELTSVSTTNTEVKDNIITLNKGGSNVPAGVEIEINDIIVNTLQYKHDTTEWSVGDAFISDVKYPVELRHAANKQYVDETLIEFQTTTTGLVKTIGSIMTGSLLFDTGAKTVHSNGTAINPSITFNNDLHTGIYNESQKINFVVGSDVSTIPLLQLSRTGTSQTGTVTINGDLNITGTVTKFNSTDTEVKDNIITLNKGGTNLPSGIEIEVDGAIASTLSYLPDITTWSVDNDFIGNVKDAVLPHHAVNLKVLGDAITNAAITKFTFVQTILANTSYVIPKASVGSNDLLDTLVDVKVKNHDNTSASYNKFINGIYDITVAFETDNITLYNETAIDLEVRVLVRVI